MKLFKGQIELKGSYKLVIKDDWFKVFDKKGNMIYYKNSDRDWIKREYDEKGNLIYGENSNGYWEKREYDEHGNMIYWENSDGDWSKKEYDEQGNMIYWENSNGYWENSKGVIIDKRPKVKELTVKDIEELLGYSVKVVK